MDPSQVIQSLQTFNQSSFESNALRFQALQAARAFIMRAETPWETQTRLVYHETMLLNCMKIGRDLKIFDELKAQNGSPKTKDHLAAVCKANPEVLGRVLKHLAAMSAIDETAEDTYSPTVFSNSMATPEYYKITDLHFRLFHGIFALPAYFKANSYTASRDPADTPMSLGAGSKMSFWEHLNADPEAADTFNQAMVTQSHYRPHFSTLYPVKERLFGSQWTEMTDTVLVDMGGGRGHDVISFAQQFSDQVKIPGRLLVQDRVEVTSTMQKEGQEPLVQYQAHDFFGEQTVKGARAYYLRQIMHDYPDDLCQKILANLRDAMTPQSVILVHDYVIPATNANPQTTALDLVMIVFLSGKERTEREWRALVDGVKGLRINKVYTHPDNPESLIEIMKSD